MVLPRDTMWYECPTWSVSCQSIYVSKAISQIELCTGLSAVGNKKLNRSVWMNQRALFCWLLLDNQMFGPLQLKRSIAVFWKHEIISSARTQYGNIEYKYHHWMFEGKCWCSSQPTWSRKCGLHNICFITQWALDCLTVQFRVERQLQTFSKPT